MAQVPELADWSGSVLKLVELEAFDYEPDTEAAWYRNRQERSLVSEPRSAGRVIPESGGKRKFSKRAEVSNMAAESGCKTKFRRQVEVSNSWTDNK